MINTLDFKGSFSVGDKSLGMKISGVFIRSIYYFLNDKFEIIYSYADLKLDSSQIKLAGYCYLVYLPYYKKYVTLNLSSEIEQPELGALHELSIEKLDLGHYTFHQVKFNKIGAMKHTVHEEILLEFLRVQYFGVIDTRSYNG